MHAAVVHDLSQPPRYQTFADPEPAEGEELIRVRAAGLHPIVKALASGGHYAGKGEVPMVPGIDGIGTLPDGTRVYFGVFGRRPWGTMSEYTIAPRDRCIPVPKELDDTLAAALPNPGMSAMLSLRERAGLKPGETVLISGATGAGGRIAVQFARHLGAGRVIGMGRNVESLRAANLDAMIRLDDPEDSVQKALAAEVEQGIDVVIDYLWGRPAELLFEALAKGFRPDCSRPIRFVEIGDTAGKTIALRGAILRSIDLHLMGSGFGAVSIQGVLNTIPSLFALAAKAEVTIDVEPVPLRDVEQAWTRKTGSSRIVFTL